jgi:hypothetical protein
MLFLVIWGPFGHPSKPQKIHKGLQVGGMYGLMSKLENKPLTKSLGPFFCGKIVQNDQKNDMWKLWKTNPTSKSGFKEFLSNFPIFSFV